MKNTKRWGRAVATALVLGATGTLAQAAPASAPTLSVVAAADARWRPANPANPDGMQMAILRGDPATGPSSVLVRFSGVSPVHTHASDYDAVVLEGNVKHWLEGEDQDAAPLLKPGSYWYQPAGERHADACLSDSCVLYVQWAGAQ